MKPIEFEDGKQVLAKAKELFYTLKVAEDNLFDNKFT